jgi:rfaE bifunctional protein nucleotidyltransferase chain/domain
MGDKPTPKKISYLAISRKAFNAAMDEGGGMYDRPFNAPRSKDDYFIFAVTDDKGWDSVPALNDLVDKSRRVTGVGSSNFIGLSIPPIQHKPNLVAALNATKPELNAYAQVGDVKMVDSMEELITTFRDMLATQKVSATVSASHTDKICTLDELAARVEQRRAGGKEPVIGFTSGVYDLIHPGHVTLLEEARKRCDYLVVAIASDRTVKAQKGADRPFIDEYRRARTIAGMSSVDSVIISDEPYHEAILKRIKPQVMFKGDEYKGQKLIGSELVDRVELIPCDEKDFNSTTSVVDTIRTRKSTGPFGAPPM